MSAGGRTDDVNGNSVHGVENEREYADPIIALKALDTNCLHPDCESEKQNKNTNAV